MKQYDTLVIGGGPAGLAAAIGAKKENGEVLLLEREQRLGGILKQCIHDGFGLIQFKERLSGPEYVERFIQEFLSLNIDYETLAFVIKIDKKEGFYHVSYVSKKGVCEVTVRSLIIATGCRERTAKQIQIHGTRPSGVFTAGCAQHFVNLLGEKIGNKCVILGSGDIGLIMARRLTLEGMKVLGVYEAKATPSGLTRNLVQCLEDYQIPLYLSHTVTRVFGEERLNAVEIMQVDEKMRPIEGTQEIVECDTLILSVGLIPENEITESLGIALDPKTKGPYVDDYFMSSLENVYICGNALHVNDLVDYVSESGLLAGKNSMRQHVSTQSVSIDLSDNFLYLVPQRVSVHDVQESMFYFRAKKEMKAADLLVKVNGKEIMKRRYKNLKPPEMEKIKVKWEMEKISENDHIEIELKEDLCVK